MIYSRLYFRKKKPSAYLVVSAFCVCVLFAVTLYSSFNTNSHKTTQSLIRMEIVNVTPSQIAVFWETAQPNSSWVTIESSKTKETKTFFDTRYLQGKNVKLKYHLAILSELDADSNYRFTIEDKEYIYNYAESKFFTIKTPKATSQFSFLRPSYGKVTLPNGKTVTNAIIMAQIDTGNYPLAALITSNGEWLIPLHHVIKKKTNTLATVTDQDLVMFELFSEEINPSVIYARIIDALPFKNTLILGKDYSFVDKSQFSNIKKPLLDQTLDQNKQVFIQYPKEYAIIPASKPLLKGGGVPGKDVYVHINSNPEISYRITVDSKGEWTILPSTSLAAGSYTLTMNTLDKDNNKVLATRNFVIAKNGEQVLGEATASATLTPTQQPTKAPTANPTYSSLSSTLSPTRKLTIAPTTVARYPTYAATTATPRTGEASYMWYLGGALLLIGAGVGMLIVF